MQNIGHFLISATVAFLHGSVAGGQTPAPPSSAAAGNPVSLIAARWRRETIVGSPLCPPEHICSNVIADVRLMHVRTLAGPRVPSALTARFEYHARIANAANVILVVRQSLADPGRFDAVWAGAALRFEPVCVDPQILTHHSIPLPRRVYVRDTELCFGQPR